MLAGVALGIDPLWAAETLTLAEAAALKDNGEVARLIEMGGNVNEASAVRADMLVDHPLVVTPLEAAVLSERADMVELLLEHGARMDPPLWTRLMCYSASVEADDVRALLQPRRPAGSVEDCNQVEIRW
jgi:ankyrin repeat protein